MENLLTHILEQEADKHPDDNERMAWEDNLTRQYDIATGLTSTWEAAQSAFDPISEARAKKNQRYALSEQQKDEILENLFRQTVRIVDILDSLREHGQVDFESPNPSACLIVNPRLIERFGKEINLAEFYENVTTLIDGIREETSNPERIISTQDIKQAFEKQEEDSKKWHNSPYNERELEQARRIMFCMCDPSLKWRLSNIGFEIISTPENHQT